MAVRVRSVREPRGGGSSPRADVETIRRFNRFYTRRLGLLEDRLLHTPFTLSEARVLYELARHRRATAKQLGDELELDPGYMSRLLRGLRGRRLVERERSADDGRERWLSLTERGRAATARIEAAARSQVRDLVGELPVTDRQRLVRAMGAIEVLLGAPQRREPRGELVLRPHRIGDMGWVLERHGALYQREYGWGAAFESLVAEIIAGFVRHRDPRRERCWIAERDGERVGSVFLVKHPEREGTAQLRLLLVEPEARGLGIGARLVRECGHFARRAGYRRIVLWTNDVLRAARKLYEREGYELTREEPHRRFGRGLVGQTWELDLERGGAR